MAKRGRKTDCSTHLPGRAHHPRPTQSDVRATETTPRHKQVADVLRVQTPVRNVVAVGFVKQGFGQKIRGFLRLQVLLKMHVDLSFFHHHRIRKLCIVDHVFEGKNMIAHQTPRLPFAQQIRNPLQLVFFVARYLFGIGKGAVNRFQQVVSDFLAVFNLVEVVARKLPVPLARGSFVVFGDLFGPGQLWKALWRLGNFRAPQNRGTHHEVIGFFGAPEFAPFVPGFTVFVYTFTAVGIQGARPKADPAVTRSVDKEGRFEANAFSVGGMLGIHVLNHLAVGHGIVRPPVVVDVDVFVALYVLVPFLLVFLCFG